MEFRPIRYNLELKSPRDHSCHVWFILAQCFQRNRWKSEELKDGQ